MSFSRWLKGTLIYLCDGEDAFHAFCFTETEEEREAWRREYVRRLVEKTDLSKVASTLPGADLKHDDDLLSSPAPLLEHERWPR